MTLIDKLKNIQRTLVKPMHVGFSETAEDFWNDFISPRLPRKEIVLQWHKVLMEYVKRPNATFALRFYNTAKKSEYGDLRRGFLTQTDKGFSFFYTDNFHAAYYLKMALDDYVPTVDEIVDAYNTRKFPARFGPDTREERELAAMPNGKNPGFTTEGYKIAHIHDVGKKYYVDGRNLSLKNIVEKYFPRGERYDWHKSEYSNGRYFVRDFKVNDVAKKYLIAEFLRFVHPFNYFLMPKMAGRKVWAIWSCAATREDAAEYDPLLHFVKNKFARIYGEAYEEFLDLIMSNREDFSAPDGLILKISYGVNPTTPPPDTKVNKIDFPEEMRLAVLREFLYNPFTSFRKLETEVMGIDSPVRGGGFKSKAIVDSYGAVKEDKGILARSSFEEAVQLVNEDLRKTLEKYKSYLEE